MGKRVRQWGQPRVCRCEPKDQCLVGGTLPMFDVACAELTARAELTDGAL